jgi:hypothetical protein
MNFIDNEGRIHDMADYGTMYNALDYESNVIEADDKRKCYGSISPRRRRPNVKRAHKYFAKKRCAYEAAITPTCNSHDQNKDTIKDIERLQKQLSDQINENVWREKESVRLQERIKLLQARNLISSRNYTRVEHAYVAIAKDGNPLNISITDNKMDADPRDNPRDEQNTTTVNYKLQLEQLFATLHDKRRKHKEDMDELNMQMAKLQKEKDISRTAQMLLLHQLNMQSPG